LQWFGVHVPGRQITGGAAGHYADPASRVRVPQGKLLERSPATDLAPQPSGALEGCISTSDSSDPSPFYKASIDDEVAKWDGWWVLLFCFMHGGLIATGN
jgi:hypothetical protein